ncbi:hypothetical protein BDP27DRAFT_1450585 [Rhodocollybia butyracea]|uniref:Uncharacterized protein n=1 Tax=Rhodocollybia butyracea TaxID=206335 RepID=A0A9P5PMW0_9AGAR|nr:hypothetical protein BDP27DRAFT_1450585 [Rhodocollybia butyracea]
MPDEVTQTYNIAIRPAITALTSRSRLNDVSSPKLQIQVIFYGIYLSLSATYVSLLRRQKNHDKFKHMFYPMTSLALFLLATAGLVLSTFDVANLMMLLMSNIAGLDSTGREATFVKTRTAIEVIYALANLIGDSILVRANYYLHHKLLHVTPPQHTDIPLLLRLERQMASHPRPERSFLIEHRHVLFTLTPTQHPETNHCYHSINTAIVFAATADIQLGSSEEFATGGFSHQVAVGDALQYAFLGINVFNNILLTGMIAGRLWYLNKAAAKLFRTANTSDKRHSTIISMFLESGSLYPIALVICLGIQVSGSSATMDLILLQIVVRPVPQFPITHLVKYHQLITTPQGIAPTLILVRTSLGISIEHAPRREHVETELEAASWKTTGNYTSTTDTMRKPSSLNNNSDFATPVISSFPGYTGGTPMADTTSSVFEDHEDVEASPAPRRRDSYASSAHHSQSGDSSYWRPPNTPLPAPPTLDSDPFDPYVYLASGQSQSERLEPVRSQS